MFTYLLQNAFPQGFSPWGFSRRGFSSRDGCSRCSSFASYLPPSHTLRPPFPVTCIVCVVFVECIRLLCNSSLPVSEIPYMCEAQEPGILVSKPLLFFMASCFPLHFPTLSAHFKGRAKRHGRMFLHSVLQFSWVPAIWLYFHASLLVPFPSLSLFVFVFLCYLQSP